MPRAAGNPSGSVHPDQARDAAGPTIAPVREETRRVRVGAESATGHGGNAEGREPAPREPEQIGLPAPPRIRLERGLCTGVGVEQRPAYLTTHLEGGGPDGGTQPREEIGRIAAHPQDDRLDHPGREPAPARVRRTDHGSGPVGEQQRQAVRRQDRQHAVPLETHGGIGFGGLVFALINNGLPLLDKIGRVDFSKAGPKYIINGAVLLLFASIDALSRQRARSS